MDYKLGELLELVTEKNSSLDYGLEDIVGVTIEKEMIPTIANLKETALDKFNIVRPHDFVYNPRTHGKKIGLGYNDTDRCYIATWNNNTFRVKKEKEDIVLPDYLYLYFKREIWDKEACFHAWGSSTVVLSWDSFCEMNIKLPTLNEQQKIVRQYKTLTDRIEVLEKINEKIDTLESIELSNSFETNDTERIELGDIAIFVDGDRGKNYPKFDEFYEKEFCLFLSASNVTKKGFEFEDCQFITEEKDKKLKAGHLERNDIVFTSRGTIGNVALYSKYVPYDNIRINSGMLIVRSQMEKISCYLLAVLLNSKYMESGIEQFKSGSAQPQLPVKDIKKILFPIIIDDSESIKLGTKMEHYENIKDANKAEINTLKKLIISLNSNLIG